PFPPLLIDFAVLRNTLAQHKRLARINREVLLVVGIAQTTGQLHVWRNLIIDLPKTRPRIEGIRIVAQEVIVPLLVRLIDRIGIDIGAAKSVGATRDRAGRRNLRNAGICYRLIERNMRRIHAPLLAKTLMIELLGEKRQQIGEDIVILSR